MVIMDTFLGFVKAFCVGGAICVICQILIDKTKLTPARILVSLVVAGVVLAGLGIYQPIVDFAGAGATVPLSGFGYTMAEGIKEAVAEKGIMGVISGGVISAAAGISAAVIFGYIFSLIAKPSDKS